MTASDVLEIGGGKTPATDGINMDIADVPSVDVCADITTKWPFESDSFRRIEAHHVLEHITQDGLETVFGEIARTLRNGGEFRATVPLANSRSAVNDPTHRSEWYWRTPAYFTDSDVLAYEVDTDGLTLRERSIRLFLTSGKWYARPPSWVLKQLSQRQSGLIELVKLPYVTGIMQFSMGVAENHD